MKYWNIQVYSVRKQLNFRAPIFVSKELRKTSFERSWTFLLKSIEVTRMFITCKVSVFWVIPVRMFPHLTGMSRFLEYISLFSPNRDTQGSKSSHSVRMQEKTDQKSYECGHFLCSVQDLSKQGASYQYFDDKKLSVLFLVHFNSYQSLFIHKTTNNIY